MKPKKAAAADFVNGRSTMRIGGRQGIGLTAADIAGLNSSFLHVISDGHGHVKIGVTEDPILLIGSIR
jgi:hypothetical protein